MSDLVLRPLDPSRPGEIAHVVRSWTMFSTTRRVDGLARWLWHRCYYHGLMAVLASCEGAAVTFDNEPDEILGWAVWEPPTPGHALTVHYVYVKPYVRRQGVGLMLLERALASVDERGHRTTHHTRDGRALLAAYRRTHGHVG